MMLDVHYFDLWNSGLFMDMPRKEGGHGLFYPSTKGWEALVTTLKFLESRMFQKKRFVNCLAPSLTKMVGSIR
jgi:hypothetical protein